jgi:hypothetical protein
VGDRALRLLRRRVRICFSLSLFTNAQHGKELTGFFPMLRIREERKRKTDTHAPTQ